MQGRDDEVVEYGEALAAAGHPQAFSFDYLHADSYTSQLNMLLDQTGGSIVDPEGTQQTFDSAESVEALSLWQELASSGIGDPDVTIRDANNQVADLESGTQSMMVVYPWGMAQIAQNAPEVYEQLAVAPLPQVDPAAPVSEGYAYYWAVNQASEQQAEAWKFIEFMSTYSEDWLADGGISPGQQPEPSPLSNVRQQPSPGRSEPGVPAGASAPEPVTCSLLSSERGVELRRTGSPPRGESLPPARVAPRQLGSSPVISRASAHVTDDGSQAASWDRC